MAPKAHRPSLGAVLVALPIGIALTLLAALPSYFNLATEQIFEEQKSLWLRSAALVAVPGVVALWRDDRARLLRRPVVVLFLALLVMLAVATVSAGATRDAVLGAHLRRHGLVTWIALAAVFAAMLPAARSLAGRDHILRALILGAVWPSVYLLLQRAGIDWFDWIAPNEGYQSGGTFGNRVLLGGYLALVVPLTAIEVWRSHWSWVLLLAVQVAALVVSGSRGAAIALVAAAAVWLGVAGWRVAPKRVVFGAAAAAALAVAVVALAPSLRPVSLVERFNPQVGSARVRILIWQGTIDLLKASGVRVWIGHGPESLRSLFGPHYLPEIGRWEQIDAMPDRAHNETLDALVSAGVLGATLELALFGATLFGALRINDPRVRAGVAAAVVAHIVEIQFGIASVTSRLSFLALAAVAAGSQEPIAVERGVAPGSPTKWLTVAALFGAASPWLSMVPSKMSGAITSGTEEQFIEYLRGLSLATPALYLAGLVIAAGMARSIAQRRRPGPAAWPQLAAIAGTVWLVVPLSIVPSRADGFSAAAASYESHQQWTEAAIAFGAAAREAPSDPYYQTGLARASIELAVRTDGARRDQLLQQARLAFERAMALDESDPAHARHMAAYFRIHASLLVGAAREAALVEADRIYARVTTWAPALTPLWEEWAWVDVDRGRPADAIVKLDRALALNQTRAGARLLRGELRLRGQQPHQALEDFDAVLAREAGNVQAWRGRVAGLVQLGRFDEAQAALGEGLKLAPADGTLLAQRDALKAR